MAAKKKEKLSQLQLFKITKRITHTTKFKDLQGISRGTKITIQTPKQNPLNPMESEDFYPKQNGNNWFQCKHCRLGETIFHENGGCSGHFFLEGWKN